MTKICSLFLIFIFALSLSPGRGDDTKEQRDARMAWWREARFGMFIHWGVYSVPAGVWKGQEVPGFGEWIMERARIPVADYKALAQQFNPTDFDADAWVSMAKDSGIKYIVITAKHHDGFAMFHSKVDPFNIYDATPFKRDPLKELAAACQKYGIKFGFYYSQAQDWTAVGGASAFNPHWDKAQDGDFGKYYETKALPQMEELLNNYQPYPAVIWFDTPTSDMTAERAAMMVTLLNKHPNVIFNNRLGGGVPGDTETPEQSIPPRGFPGRDWETCMTINITWGYKTSDTNWKSAEELLRNLIEVASSGGNYLLNVGPDSHGVIPAPETERLRTIGKWLKINGESIYGTSAAPVPQKPTWGRMTQKPGKVYLHIFNWPADGKIVVPIANQVMDAYLLAQPETKFSTTPGAGPNSGLTVNLTGTAPDPVVSVVVLKTKGDVQPVNIPISPADDGTLTLNANGSLIVGNTMNVQNNPPNLGVWTDENDYAHWYVRVTKPGKYKVSMTYALGSSPNGSTLTLTAGSQSLTIQAAATPGGWADFKKADAGVITLDKSDKTDLILKGAKNGGQGVINLQELTLTPVP
jgi:alpha-L-fucosidase